jgi:hypothetical protein
MKFSSSGGTIRPEGENFFGVVLRENDLGKSLNRKEFILNICRNPAERFHPRERKCGLS